MDIEYTTKEKGVVVRAYFFLVNTGNSLSLSTTNLEGNSDILFGVIYGWFNNTYINKAISIPEGNIHNLTFLNSLVNSIRAQMAIFTFNIELNINDINYLNSQVYYQFTNAYELLNNADSYGINIEYSGS